jgi:hypothetical protein
MDPYILYDYNLKSMKIERKFKVRRNSRITIGRYLFAFPLYVFWLIFFHIITYNIFFHLGIGNLFIGPRMLNHARISSCFIHWDSLLTIEQEVSSRHYISP